MWLSSLASLVESLPFPCLELSVAPSPGLRLWERVQPLCAGAELVEPSLLLSKAAELQRDGWSQPPFIPAQFLAGAELGEGDLAPSFPLVPPELFGAKPPEQGVPGHHHGLTWPHLSAFPAALSKCSLLCLTLGKDAPLREDFSLHRSR